MSDNVISLRYVISTFGNWYLAKSGPDIEWEQDKAKALRFSFTQARQYANSLCQSKHGQESNFALEPVE